MNTATPAYTPFASGTDLFTSPTEPEENDTTFVSQYQSLVGSLMYAMLGTRPDIAFAVTKLSQFNSNPSEQHFKAAKHVLRYLKATRQVFIRFWHRRR